MNDRNLKYIVRFYNSLHEDLKDEFTKILPTIKKVDLYTLFKVLVKNKVRRRY